MGLLAVIKDLRVLFLLFCLLGSVSAITYRGIETGLDIQGGTRVVMKMEATSAVVETPLDENQLREKLEKELGTEVRVWRKEKGLIPVEIMKHVEKEELVAALGDQGKLLENSFTHEVSPETREEVIRILQTRANWLGVRDIRITTLGPTHIQIEIAGVSIEQAEEVLARQGKFEAKVERPDKAEEVLVYTGTDIVRVFAPRLRAGTTWEVPVAISQQGAQRFSEATRGASEAKLNIYIDEELKTTLDISQDLIGKVATQAVVTGTAPTKEEAIQRAKNMRTILESGALPLAVRIDVRESISPLLGKRFLGEALKAGFGALFALVLVLLIRYRSTPLVVLPIFVTVVSEVIIILGVAALITWQIDLAAIAGIIMAVGTGVDQQIIITDELMRGEVVTGRRGLLARISRAFFIIFAAAATTGAAMFILAYMGFGYLRGFAVTTMIGVLAGVGVTRPAFVTFVRSMLKG